MSKTLKTQNTKELLECDYEPKNARLFAPVKLTKKRGTQGGLLGFDVIILVGTFYSTIKAGAPPKLMWYAICDGEMTCIADVDVFDDPGLIDYHCELVSPTVPTMSVL